MSVEVLSRCSKRKNSARLSLTNNIVSEGMGLGTTEQKGEMKRTLLYCVSRKKEGEELGPHCS